MIETVWKDLRYAMRSFLRAPGFTAVAIVSLALGIGANTTIFSLVNAVFLRQLAVAEPDRVMSVFTNDEKNTGSLQVSYPNFEEFRDRNEVFSGLFSFTGAGLSLSGQGNPEQIFGLLVSGNYFDVLGVRPAIGRAFLPQEDAAPGAGPVVVLSHGTWSRRFGADPNVLGRTITLNRQPFTVVGVAPEGFRGTFAIGGPELWLPMSMHDQVLSGTFKEWFNDRRFLGFSVMGRLRPGVSRQQAEASMKTLARQLEQEYPEPNKGRTVSLLSLQQSTINPQQRDLFLRAGQLLMTVVGLVLLISCANVANLLLARATSRRREIALRLSLGAGRWRLVRQLLTESMLLSLLGGVAGLVLAFWLRDVLWSFRPPFFPQDGLDFRLDMRVLLFTAGLSLLTGVLFGLAPALEASRLDLVTAIKSGGVATADTPRKRWGLRSALVISQVALSLVSLVGAGLFLTSLRNAQNADLGFSPDALLTLSVDPGAGGYDEAHGREYYRALLEKVRSQPGVKSASMAEWLPLTGGGFWRSVFLEGQAPPPDGRGVLVPVNAVETGYFTTLGLPFKRGRDFTDADRSGAVKVVIVSDAMAKKFWPGDDPIGRRFKFFGETEPVEVVGVVADSRMNSVGEDPIPTAYYPFQQNYGSQMSLVVRAAGEPSTALPAVRGAAQAIDADLPITNVAVISDLVRNSLWAPRMGAGLLAVFGGLALTLAALGLYGVMAYTVTQRTQEIGIRMAIGARQRDVFALVLRHGLLLVGLGLAAGLVGAVGAARLVSGLLFGVSPAEPMVYLGTSLLLCVVSVVASCIPARRATRVDPLVALRYE